MYDRVASNVRKSWALMAVFVVLLALVGLVAAEMTGAGFGLVGGLAAVAILMAWASYFFSDSVALAMSAAKPADPGEHQRLHNVVEGLCLGAGIPKPRVFVVNDPAPNAFATGRDPAHAAVAVTTGLLEKMGRDELEGVIAHELSHIKNRDSLVMTLSVTLMGVIVLVADVLIRATWWSGGSVGGGRGRRGAGSAGGIIVVIGLVILLLSPLIARMLHFAISRRREFLADADAVLLTRQPAGLIGALEKLRSDQAVVRTASRATAHLWIESPIQRQAVGRGDAPKAWLNRLFDTHPPLEERIAALRATPLGGAGPEAGLPGR